MMDEQTIIKSDDFDFTRLIEIINKTLIFKCWADLTKNIKIAKAIVSRQLEQLETHYFYDYEDLR